MSTEQKVNGADQSAPTPITATDAVLAELEVLRAANEALRAAKVAEAANAAKPLETLFIQFTTPEGKALFTEYASYRTFSSGKKGYGAYGKANFGGRRYQISINVVEIGS